MIKGAKGGGIATMGRIGGSIGKSGPMIGGGGPERGGGFASVGFARGFGKVGGERAASANALKFNTSQRFSEGGPTRAVNTNFRSFESPRPLRSNLSSRHTELFRAPVVPRTENQFIKPSPKRSILMYTKSAVRWALDRSQKPQILGENLRTENSAKKILRIEKVPDIPNYSTDLAGIPTNIHEQSKKGRTLEHALKNLTQARTLNEHSKQSAIAREQALEVSIFQRLSRIVGPEKARLIVLNTRKSAGVNLNHSGGVTERKQRLGLARVLTGTEIGAEAVAAPASQTEAVGRATPSTATESTTRNREATRKKERTQTVFERQIKLTAQKTKEKTLKKDKKTKNQNRTKIFQEYLAAKFARLSRARTIFTRISDENRQKGIDIVSGSDIAGEFVYTKDQESLAISQLGRAQKDGSHTAVRNEIAVQKYVTEDKLEGIINAHAPTEIVEMVTTRQSTDRELAEVFDDPDKVPAALTATPGENVVQINASLTRAEKITEDVSEKIEEKPSSAGVAPASAEVQAQTVTNRSIDPKIVQFPNRLALTEEFFEPQNLLEAA